ncbi:hypothetical protein AA313_de0202706 [Arthrobotrys entomopaga]|nr:hypothetical protein AA313_de0202706 [Arthrobotrys entomopaga]
MWSVTRLSIQSSTAMEGDVKVKRYWVSTTATERKKISAAIREPNGNYYTTRRNYENASVAVNGITPIIYSTKNVRVTGDDNDSTTGTFNGTISQWLPMIGNYSKSFVGQWTAQNYQLSMDLSLIKQAEIRGYHSGLDTLNHAIKYESSGPSTLNIFYMWELGSRQDVKAGHSFHKKVTDPAHAMELEITAGATISTNTRPGSLCLTRLQHSCDVSLITGYDFWNSLWTENVSCKIYDEWGNLGEFKFDFSGTGKDQHIVLKDIY